MSKEQYEALKAKEKSKTQGKNLAVNGVTTFKSRQLDYRAADEAKAMGEIKKYRFPDKNGNKDNYVRQAGGRSSFQSSKEYQQMLKEKEDEIKRQREASAKISGAAGGFRFGGAKKQAAKPAPEPEKKAGGLGSFFGGLFGK